MNNSFYQLFLVNLRMVYRNKSGVFWTLAMPTIFFVIFALFRLERFINLGGRSYADFFLPGFLAYVFMQGGLYGLGYFLVDLKAKGVIKRFLVTPIKPFEMAISVVAARIIIMFVQLVLLTAIGALLFHTHLTLVNIPLILLVTLIGGSLFLLVGLLVSTAATSYESAAPITAGIGLPLMFLGDVFYPLGLLPDFLEKIGRILPLAHLSESLRMLYSGSVNWERLGVNIGSMLVWFVILLLLTRWRFRLEE
jgi:ABC-2 type transport system permease protein